MEYGYARVSTKEQNEQRQLIALREFGIEDKRIFVDKQSGKDFERPNYRRLIKKLQPDDTLVIKSIDRLGRNYEEILEQWRSITKEKQAPLCAAPHITHEWIARRKKNEKSIGIYLLLIKHLLYAIVNLRICQVLNRGVDDIMELIPDNEETL